MITHGFISALITVNGAGLWFKKNNGFSHIVKEQTGVYEIHSKHKNLFYYCTAYKQNIACHTDEVKEGGTRISLCRVNKIRRDGVCLRRIDSEFVITCVGDKK